MSREAMKHIKTWSERCEEHPDHQMGVVSERMIQARMQEEIDELRQALDTDLARVGEVGVWGECEPQEEVEDGWCDWVCPKPSGYLMQCCDCELIHEVDFRVVQYEPKPSEVYEVVDDPNLQAQMRLRRRDDLSPKREWAGLTDEQVEDEWERITRHSIFGGDRSEGRAMYISPDEVIGFSRAIEQALKEKNHG